MLYIDCGGLLCALNNKYDRVVYLARGFIVDPEDKKPDIEITLTDEDIEIEKSITPDAGPEKLEALSFLRRIANDLPAKDAFLFHAVMLEYKEEAYAFTARSGTGKSTHAKYWKELLGEDLDIICGDKSIIRFIDGRVYGGATPWRGKENWGRGGMAPLRSCGFIVRAEGEKPHAERMEKEEVLKMLMTQTLMPYKAGAAAKFLDLLDEFIDKVPFYKLYVNMSLDSAEMSFSALTENGGPET